MKVQTPPRRAAVPFALLACLLVPACESAHEKEHEHEHVHHKLVATSPKQMDVTVSQQYVCQIHSRNHIDIQALEGGYLEEIPIKEGQAVKKGDVMFQILPTLLKARLQTEQAEVRLAELEYKNTKKLYDEGQVVSQQEVFIYQAKLARAEAKLKLAEAELAFATIKAPFDGVVDRMLQQQGSLIKEGDDLTTLSDNRLMWVYFNVPEKRYLEYMSDLLAPQQAGAKDDDGDNEKPIPVADLPKAVADAVAKKYPGCKILGAELETEDGEIEYEVKILAADGKRLELELSKDGKILAAEPDDRDQPDESKNIQLILANGQTFPQTGGNVTVETNFNNETGNIKFRVDFPNPTGLLRHGQTGNVVIQRVVKNALVIPQRATFEVLDKRYVLVVGPDHVVHQRAITVLREQEDVFIIDRGLSVTDKFILDGVRQVRDGDTVEYEFRTPDDALANQKYHAE